MSNTSPRRSFLRAAVVAGAAGILTTQTTAEASTHVVPGPVDAASLLPGDMISGPGATIVRLAEVEVLVDGDVRLSYTSPFVDTTDPVPMLADGLGYPPSRQFLVYARDVGESAVKVTPSGTTPPPVVDGGAP